MKMSGYFPTPLDPSIPVGETLAFDTTGEAAEAAVHAVNHHDALVEALDGVLEMQVWNDHGNCVCCGARHHRKDCVYVAARELLEAVTDAK